MGTGRLAGIILASVLLGGVARSAGASASTDTLMYVALAEPCRLLDTRSPGPGALTASHGTYTFGPSDADIESAAQHGSSTGCGIPAGVYAVSVNFNMFNATASGNILTWPTDYSKPAAGSAVYNPASAQVVYNGATATILLGTFDGRFDLSLANGQADMTINVVGYWRMIALGPDISYPGAFTWGFYNHINAYYGGAGGSNNTVTGPATQVFGQFNTGGGNTSIGLGYGNTTSADRTVAIGDSNTVSALHGMAIGHSNTADGDYAIAMGQRASSNGFTDGFVFGDGVVATRNTSNNQFMARATGGFVLYSGTTSTGVQLSAGSGAWTTLSDRNAKRAFAPIDGREVLDRVVAMPLSTWQYKAQDSQYRHMGPMAQDFYAAFGLGESDTGIDTIDADGVALAAIQGLNAKLERDNADKDRQIAQDHRDIAELRAQIAGLAASIQRSADH